MWQILLAIVVVAGVFSLNAWIQGKLYDRIVKETLQALASSVVKPLLNPEGDVPPQIEQDSPFDPEAPWMKTWDGGVPEPVDVPWELPDHVESFSPTSSTPSNEPPA